MPGENSQVFIVPWGGQVARGAGDGPLAGRDAAYVVHPLLMWNHAATTTGCSSSGAASARRCVRTAPARPTRTSSGTRAATGSRPASESTTLAGWREVKARWDAGNAFHGNHNIRPADGPRAA